MIMRELNNDRSLEPQECRRLARILQRSKSQADLPEVFKKYIKQVETDERPEEPETVSDAEIEETVRKVKNIINQFEPATVYNIEVVAGLRPGPETAEIPVEQRNGSDFFKKCRQAESDFLTATNTPGLPFWKIEQQLTKTENALLKYLIFPENI